MHDDSGASNKKNFFDRQKNLFPAILILPVILALVLVNLYLFISDSLKPAPQVEIHAQNNFKKTLYVVTDRDYAPYSYIDESGNYQGFDVEMINEIANRLQMNLDLRLVEWNMANQLFKDGEADVIMNMESDLIVGDSSIIATLPTTEKQYVVYGKHKISSVAELYGRRVASYEKIFKALKTGEFEFAICPIQVGDSFLEKFQLEDIFSSYAVTHVYGSMVLHPQDTMLRVKLNAVLIQMQQEGRLDELQKKWITRKYENMTFQEMLESRPWLVASIFSAVIFVFLMVIYIIFQYRNERTREAYTKSLQENLETIERQKEELQENLGTIERQKDELKQKQEELLDAKIRAEESSKAKSTFLFNMSHDIRTPMNAITGYVELSKKLHGLCENCTRPHCPDEVPTKMYDFLQKIDASSQHLLSLINDVLEMSRIESGKMELEENPANICKTLADVYDMFITQMQTKNIDFTVDTSAVKNKFVICDAHRLNRVLLNLLSNAYKFTPKDGKISVTLTQKNDGEENLGDYELRVKDSGIGMSEEFAKKVFEAFERERTSTVSKIQGTGLGMAITKNIVDLMGGTIEVVTAQGKGTEFIINVTFKLSDEKVDDDEEEKISDAEVDFSQKKLLLVDDIEVNREIAAMLLEGSGFIVETAVDGADAVKKISESKPGDFDAILMDIQMPVMNGYEATKKIRALENPKLAKIPILAMTANAFSEDVQAARMETLAEILSK